MLTTLLILEDLSLDFFLDLCFWSDPNLNGLAKEILLQGVLPLQFLSTKAINMHCGLSLWYCWLLGKFLKSFWKLQIVQIPCLSWLKWGTCFQYAYNIVEWDHRSIMESFPYMGTLSLFDWEHMRHSLVLYMGSWWLIENPCFTVLSLPLYWQCLLPLLMFFVFMIGNEFFLLGASHWYICEFSEKEFVIILTDLFLAWLCSSEGLIWMNIVPGVVILAASLPQNGVASLKNYFVR